MQQCTGGNFPRRQDVSTDGSRVNDDAQLVAATLAGDTASFGQLVDRYQDRLVNSATRFLGNHDDARDVVQDAFVQAFTKLPTFRGNAAFYTWLYRIAFNLAMTHARRRRPQASLDRGRDELGNEPMDLNPGPVAGAAVGERAALVHAALAELDDEFRQAIVLRELEGCTYEQIAEIADIPVGTVRSRLYRARLALRDRLAPILGEQIVEEPS